MVKKGSWHGTRIAGVFAFVFGLVAGGIGAVGAGEGKGVGAQVGLSVVVVVVSTGSVTVGPQGTGGQGVTGLLVSGNFGGVVGFGAGAGEGKLVQGVLSNSPPSSLVFSWFDKLAELAVG